MANRLTQQVAEYVSTGAPNARVTQCVVEYAETATALQHRLSQLLVEYVGYVTQAQVTQLLAEYGEHVTYALLSQLLVEYAEASGSPSRISQILAEYLDTGLSNARLTQLLVEYAIDPPRWTATGIANIWIDAAELGVPAGLEWTAEGGTSVAFFPVRLRAMGATNVRFDCWWLRCNGATSVEIQGYPGSAPTGTVVARWQSTGFTAFRVAMPAGYGNGGDGNGNTGGGTIGGVDPGTTLRVYPGYIVISVDEDPGTHQIRFRLWGVDPTPFADGTWIQLDGLPGTAAHLNGVSYQVTEEGYYLLRGTTWDGESYSDPEHDGPAYAYRVIPAASASVRRGNYVF